MNGDSEFEAGSRHEIALACVLRALLSTGTASHKSILQACGRATDVTRALQTLSEAGMIYSWGRFHVQYQLRDDIGQQFEAARARQEELQHAVGRLRENERRLKSLRSEAYRGSSGGVIEAVCDAVQIYADRSGIQVGTERVRQQLESVFIG